MSIPCSPSPAPSSHFFSSLIIEPTPHRLRLWSLLPHFLTTNFLNFSMISPANFAICRVCGTEGPHGKHFGVTSCRACAAFFRRRANSKFQKCGGGNCNSSKKFCGPCRLEKCFEVGMKTLSFQYNRDGLKSLPNTVECFVGRPGMVLFWDADAPTHKTLIDVTYLIKEAQRVLTELPDSVSLCQSQLHRLSLGINNTEHKGYGRCTRIDRKEVIDTWQYYFLTVARWLTRFDAFQNLELGLKMKILQVAWHIWATLDRHYSTAIYRKSNPEASKTEIVARKGLLMDVMKTSFDATWLSDYPAKDISYFFRQSSKDNFDIIDAISKLELTEIELTYMLAQLSFEYAAKRYQGEIMTICERFQEILANDLHLYFVNDRKMVNYSTRLMKMMKINNAIQRNLWEHRPRIELAKVFNIIKIEFSHPEMFKDSGFH